MSDEIGNYSKALSRANYESIKKFYQEHPGCSVKDICNGLNLHRATVHRHKRVIRKEWYRK